MQGLETDARPLTDAPSRRAIDRDLKAASQQWQRSFGTSPWLFQEGNGFITSSAQVPIANPERFEPQLQLISEGAFAQCLAADAGVSLWGVPIYPHGTPLVALAAFVTDIGPATPELASQQLGCSIAKARDWLAATACWPDGGLTAALQAYADREILRRDLIQTRIENERLALQLTQTFEELVTIHRIATNLKLDTSQEELFTPMLQSLRTCIQAKNLALVWHDSQNVFHIGDSIDSETAKALLATVRGNEVLETPKVINDPDATAEHRAVIAIDIIDEGHATASLLAIEHQEGEEFGTVEADLLHSLSGMLGVFFGNKRLFGETRQMFEDAVRALVSAIEAKDPYTCGHSNRVAELARMLASQLGEGEEFCETIHMAGLLHDIGKIGIDDAVLRKPGRLTEEEFEHIKEHPDLGCRILRDVPQFANLLPGVRHHHEAIDGSGYPDGLKGDEIPRIAQIIAVADSFDAMTSSRPYRQGMPLGKVIQILEAGRGQQWAEDVVDALIGMHRHAMDRLADCVFEPSA